MNKQTEPHHHKNKVISALVLPFSSKGKPNLKSPHPNITNILQVDIAGKTSIHVLGRFGLSTSRLNCKIKKEFAMYIPSKSIPRSLKFGTEKCVTDEQKYETQEITNQILSWLAKFRGVASKYLTNYWAWFSQIRQMQLQISQQELYMHTCF